MLQTAAANKTKQDGSKNIIYGTVLGFVHILIANELYKIFEFAIFL